MNVLLFLSVCIGLFSAWYLGYTRNKPQDANKLNLHRDYLVGLNFLLNEEPDKAVDVFIKMLEVDSNTVETHLAVGKLFRRRGEVDRAIRIHQNLIARPQLNKVYREQSLFELGQDYLSAGVLDRAERVFLEVLGIKEYCIPALNALLDIYQQEKAWESAIEIAHKIAVATRKNMKPIIAHYYCELAESYFAKNYYDQGYHALKKALAEDPNCVRASLLHAKAHIAQGQHKIALKSLKRIKDQNPDFLSEAMESLAHCFEVLNEEEKLISYLSNIIKEFPDVPIALILPEKILQWQGNQVILNMLTDYVRRFPSIRGLHLFIKLYTNNIEGQIREDLDLLQNLTKKLMMDKPDYQCVSCGFSGKSLHWHCPGCKQWSTIKPIHCVEHGYRESIQTTYVLNT